MAKCNKSKEILCGLFTVFYFSDDTLSRECGSNGNGITPPGTPKRSQSPRGGYLSPKPMSRSSSPVPIPCK